MEGGQNLEKQGNQYRKVCSLEHMFTAGSQEWQIWFKGHAVKKPRLWMKSVKTETDSGLLKSLGCNVALGKLFFLLLRMKYAPIISHSPLNTQSPDHFSPRAVQLCSTWLSDVSMQSRADLSMAPTGGNTHSISDTKKSEKQKEQKWICFGFVWLLRFWP